MSGTDEFEPQVGEIAAVRTFRIGPDGRLYPLFSKRAWQPGANTATCALPGDSEHRAPDPECTCGFYAYSSLAAAREYPHARYVLAVIDCWGRVITATRGLRAEHACIRAIWFAPEVPAELTAQVVEQYPEAHPYTDRDHMLAAFSLDASAPAQDSRLTTNLRRTAVALAVAAGALPMALIASAPYGWWVWGALLSVLMIAAFERTGQHGDAVAGRRRLISFALALWMIAPLTGAAGVLLLRLPLLQLCALGAAQRLAANRAARTFPAQI